MYHGTGGLERFERCVHFITQLLQHRACLSGYERRIRVTLCLQGDPFDLCAQFGQRSLIANADGDCPNLVGFSALYVSNAERGLRSLGSATSSGPAPFDSSGDLEAQRVPPTVTL